LKAGSSCPPEATRTARTTAASIPGKASCKVAWFCVPGEIGRGGGGGGISSTASTGGCLGAPETPLTASLGTSSTSSGLELAYSEFRMHACGIEVYGKLTVGSVVGFSDMMKYGALILHRVR
jgi:hypothetical protein